jgi:hypothetical protein
VSKSNGDDNNDNDNDNSNGDGNGNGQCEIAAVFAFNSQLHGSAGVAGACAHG